jgi:hypothetical protein
MESSQRESLFLFPKHVFMKIGLLSDTHSHLDPRVLDYFKDCDEVWHAGDIGDRSVADTLEKSKPFRAVFGNIDDKEIQMRFPEDLRFQCEGLNVWMLNVLVQHYWHHQHENVFSFVFLGRKNNRRRACFVRCRHRQLDLFGIHVGNISTKNLALKPISMSSFSCSHDKRSFASLEKSRSSAEIMQFAASDFQAYLMGGLIGVNRNTFQRSEKIGAADRHFDIVAGRNYIFIIRETFIDQAADHADVSEFEEGIRHVEAYAYVRVLRRQCSFQ